MSMLKTNSVRWLAAAGMAAALVGCGVLDAAPPNLYTLNPPTGFDSTLPKADWTLSVEVPVAAGIFDTARVLSIRQKTAVEPFAGVAWTDRAPAMLQSLLVEAFENSRRILSVGRDAVGLRADFLLKTELRDFQAEYDTPGPDGIPRQVRVRFVAKLVSMPRRVVEAGETFEAIVPVSGTSFPSIVAAFDKATTDTLVRLVDWTLHRGNMMAAEAKKAEKK